MYKKYTPKSWFYTFHLTPFKVYFSKLMPSSFIATVLAWWWPYYRQDFRNVILVITHHLHPISFSCDLSL